MKNIILTGGGTAGHVTPNIALLPGLKERDYEVSYIGSYDGIEKKLIEEFGIPYYGISSGKLRRYFDLKNFTDPLKVIKGYSEAVKLMKQLKPDVLFSKGGFVTVPVVLAAKKCKVPIIIHESDMTPGLANRICTPAATKVCCNFPETLGHLPHGKAVLTGSPIRKELLQGNRQDAIDFCEFPEDRQTIMIIGGSMGAAAINKAVRDILPELLKDFNVVHICGKGKTEPDLNGLPGYAQFEYIKKELSDIFALSDLVISRAGANSICELLSLKKPNILIPLSRAASRGDQILNAHSFERQGFSAVLEEESLTSETLLSKIQEVYASRDSYIAKMSTGSQADPIHKILDLIEECAGK